MNSDRLRPLEDIRLTHGQPRRFRWRGQWYIVADLLDSWREVGEWWKEDSSEFRWWRVQTDDQGVFEIGWREADKTWWLGRVWD